MEDAELQSFYNVYNRLRGEVVTKLKNFTAFCNEDTTAENDNLDTIFKKIITFKESKELSVQFELFDETFLLKAEINPNVDVRHVLLRTYSIVKTEQNFLGEKLVAIDNVEIRLDIDGNYRFVNRQDRLGNFNAMYIKALCDYIKLIFAKRVINVEGAFPTFIN
jgi:hypothetical protein